MSKSKELLARIGNILCAWWLFFKWSSTIKILLRVHTSSSSHRHVTCSRHAMHCNWNWHNHKNLCGATDSIMKTYVEKLIQSWKLMWRKWHNHQNLCGETDTIMKTYVEKLTQSWKLMRRNWHNHENLCDYLFVISQTNNRSIFMTLMISHDFSKIKILRPGYCNLHQFQITTVFYDRKYFVKVNVTG